MRNDALVVQRMVALSLEMRGRYLNTNRLTYQDGGSSSPFWQHQVAPFSTIARVP
jgi:hypothetical protein